VLAGIATASHGGAFELIELDLASLTSVRACAGALTGFYAL
jgi:hypothetical protein